MDDLGDWFRGSFGHLADPLARDLGCAAEAALAGGRLVERFYEASVETKPGKWGGPVTDADRASHDAILEVLRSRLPGDEVRSEEDRVDGLTAAADSPCERVWLVDPLDGTKEFLSRNGEFSVMVGLASRGKASVGAVYQPEPGRLYLGVVGQGAWVVESPGDRSNVRALRVEKSTSNDGRPLRVVRSRSHADERLEPLAELPGGVDWVVSGSVGIKCAMIAEGGADLYVHPVPYLKEWDTCAPEAVLRGAEGWVTDCLGAALDYGKTDPHQPGGILAASPDVGSRLAPLVARLFRGEPTTD